MSKTNSGYSGADWVKSALKIEDMSPLGEKVADLLGDAFYGIYHLKNKTLHQIDWSNDHHIVVKLGKSGLATVDSDTLTVLVVLCHDRMLRMEISPCSHWSMEFIFHARPSREGSISVRCPAMEDHIAAIRQRYVAGEGT